MSLLRWPYWAKKRDTEDIMMFEKERSGLMRTPRGTEHIVLSHNETVQDLEIQINKLRRQVLWQQRVLEEEPWLAAGYVRCS